MTHFPPSNGTVWGDPAPGGYTRTILSGTDDEVTFETTPGRTYTNSRHAWDKWLSHGSRCIGITGTTWGAGSAGTITASNLNTQRPPWPSHAEIRYAIAAWEAAPQGTAQERVAVHAMADMMRRILP